MENKKNLQLVYLILFVNSFCNLTYSTINEINYRSVGFVTDSIMLTYFDPHLHYESPERLKVIISSLQANNIYNKLTVLNPIQYHDSILEYIHTQKHINSIYKYKEHVPAIKAAVGSVISAVDAVHNGTIKRAFCAIRPPGHHARNTNQEEGFCYFNNVAIGAKYAQKNYGYKKILIIDWDFHHGNGTEEFFYEDPTVLFISTHNLHSYPGTGSPKRTGKGAGKGYNINIHLPCGSTVLDISKAWESSLYPLLDSFKPDLIFISAGFDSGENDPLGCFKVTGDGFYYLTKKVTDIANKYCNGNVISVLEGGYNLQTLPIYIEAHLKALAN